MTRARIRDLGIVIGDYPTGAHNAITDVAGVLVGHTTVVYDEPRVARTGVTMVLPRGGNIAADRAFAGFHRFNGNGEMTGLCRRMEQFIKELFVSHPQVPPCNNQAERSLRHLVVSRKISSGSRSSNGTKSKMRWRPSSAHGEQRGSVPSSNAAPS